jgi:RNA polymerase sigma-70 factor (ECF subfamily)
LLERAKAGDAAALETLLARYGTRLRQWAHRRLPHWARDLSDTDDLVQVTLLKTVRNLGGFSADTELGFQNYLRRAISNAIRDEIRRTRTRPTIAALDPTVASDDPSPLELAVGRGRLARYEAALAKLTVEERDVIVARLEFGFTHGELAAALGKGTPDAARKFCKKSISRLLLLMGEAETQPS